MKQTEKRMLAIWGSPGAGKSTTAVKLAWHYSRKEKQVALVFCDDQTPMLPCITREEELLRRCSLGSIFAARRVIPDLVEAKQCRVKGAEFLHLYGFLKGEHAGMYPPLGMRQASELLACLYNRYDCVILDCSSDITHNLLSRMALEEADEVVRLLGCSLKSLSYYASQNSVLREMGIEERYFYRVVSNVKEEALAAKMYQKTAFELPYSEELNAQAQAGDLLREMEYKQSRTYLEHLTMLAGELES